MGTQPPYEAPDDLQVESTGDEWLTSGKRLPHCQIPEIVFGAAKWIIEHSINCKTARTWVWVKKPFQLMKNTSPRKYYIQSVLPSLTQIK